MAVLQMMISCRASDLSFTIRTYSSMLEPPRQTFREGGGVGDVAHRLHFLAPRQFFRQGHDIDCAMGVDQFRHAAVDETVRVQKEVF